MTLKSNTVTNVWSLPWKWAEDSKIMPEIQEFKIKVSIEEKKKITVTIEKVNMEQLTKLKI